MVGYEGKLQVYLKELKDLTYRVAMLESSADKYIKLDFELLRIELREFEALVSQLKDSFNSSSPLFDSLYTEVKIWLQTLQSIQYTKICFLYLVFMYRKSGFRK